MSRLVRLSKGATGARNLFFFHAGNGEIQNYVHLSAMLPSFACWAFRASDYDDYSPRNSGLEDNASEALAHLLRFEDQGPFLLAGWCFGGLRAFETARQLEVEGFEVGFVGLINSHAPISSATERKGMLKRYALITDGPNARAVFDARTERALLDKWLMSAGLGYASEEENALDGLWSSFVSEFTGGPSERAMIAAMKKDIPPDRALAIPYFNEITLERLCYYLAVMRSDARAQAYYLPTSSVAAQVTYFSASESLVPDRYAWRRFCHSVVRFREVSGDHFNMFNIPNVTSLAVELELAVQTASG